MKGRRAREGWIEKGRKEREGKGKGKGEGEYGMEYILTSYFKCWAFL